MKTGKSFPCCDEAQDCRHYNRHNEWSFDFKETREELVPFQNVVFFGVVCCGLIALIETFCIRFEMLPIAPHD